MRCSGDRARHFFSACVSRVECLRARRTRKHNARLTRSRQTAVWRMWSRRTCMCLFLSSLLPVLTFFCLSFSPSSPFLFLKRKTNHRREGKTSHRRERGNANHRARGGENPTTGTEGRNQPQERRGEEGKTPTTGRSRGKTNHGGEEKEKTQGEEGKQPQRRQGEKQPEEWRNTQQQGLR